MSITKYGFTLGTLALLLGCNETQQSPSIAMPVVEAIETQEYGFEPNNSSLYYPAVIVASHLTELSFRSSGEVVSLLVREGDLIKKGQVLARLNPSEIELEIKNTQASYIATGRQYARARQLVGKGMLAQSQFDEIEARFRIAKSEYELAKLKLSFTELIAPRDGIVSRVHIENHENITIGQSILNIHDSDRVDISVQVADKVIASIPPHTQKEEVKATVKVANDMQYQATITEYTPEKDHITATYRVVLSMPMPKDAPLLDGMAAEVLPSFAQREQAMTTTSIPVEAVVTPDGSSLHQDAKFVWTLQDNQTVKLKQVSASQLDQGKLLVTQGLRKNEKVIISGTARLRDGMQVQLMTSEIN